MTAVTQPLYTPWSLTAEDDRRFRRILQITLLVFLLSGLIMPYLPVSKIERHATESLPPRLARLILEQKPVPPPPQVQKPVTEAKPLPKKPEAPAPQKAKPQPQKQRLTRPSGAKKTVSARQQAQQAGLLALSDSLQDLRQNTVATSLKQSHDLSQSGGKASKTERAILTYGTTSGSDGINTARLSRNTGGTTLAGRSTLRVSSPSGTAGAGGGSGGNGTRGGDGTAGRGARLAGRSIEEIQMVFDRNKGAIYSVYNRALRSDSSLQGKVVLRLTIAPSGKVTRCELVSSELNDAVLGEKIAQRVKLFDFGAKNVEAVTITYPIDFLPA
ncbi:MAG: AgmX/PglI C-terminal domain-containing protein [Gammaproteobacteria bacterium]